jgi:hypothetical protein
MGNGVPPWTYKRGDTCPVCHLKIDYVERRVVRRKVQGVERTHVYYYAGHFIVGPDGQKHTKKCYLGAETYDYVARKNPGVNLKGMIFGLTRYADYIKDNLAQLEAELASGRVDPDQAKEVLNALKEAMATLQRLIAKVEDYVAQESASAQPEGDSQ